MVYADSANTCKGAEGWSDQLFTKLDHAHWNLHQKIPLPQFYSVQLCVNYYLDSLTIDLLLKDIVVCLHCRSATRVASTRAFLKASLKSRGYFSAPSCFVTFRQRRYHIWSCPVSFLRSSPVLGIHRSTIVAVTLRYESKMYFKKAFLTLTGLSLAVSCHRGSTSGVGAGQVLFTTARLGPVPYSVNPTYCFLFSLQIFSTACLVISPHGCTLLSHISLFKWQQWLKVRTWSYWTPWGKSYCTSWLHAHTRAVAVVSVLSGWSHGSRNSPLPNGKNLAVLSDLFVVPEMQQ